MKRLNDKLGRNLSMDKFCLMHIHLVIMMYVEGCIWKCYTHISQKIEKVYEQWFCTAEHNSRWLII